MRLIDADSIQWEYKCIAKEEIDEVPTIKAIPLELIEKELKRLDEDIKWAWYYGNVALDKMEYLKMWLTIKLEDWEKENERRWNNEQRIETDKSHFDKTRPSRDTEVSPVSK